MATFVLVHGGGHGGWCYQKLAKLLRAEGHEVYCPTLTGLGDRAHLLNPAINLDTHIEDVVSLLHHEDLRDVYLAGHSYGGMVITGIADRALERVGHLVFLDAAQPKNDEALADIAYTMMNAAYQGMRVVDGMEMVLFLDPAMGNLFGVTDPSDVAWMHPRLKPHPWACFSQKLRMTRETETRKLPRTIINCTETLTLRPPEFRHRALEGDHVFEIDTGHDLMITEPQRVADMLIQVVAREKAKQQA
jgi:pimeloyl-ACP methyl ester carboxylesterase